MPSLQTESDRQRCPKCGSEALTWKAVSYWREQTTDHCVPAKSVLECNFCGTKVATELQPKPSWWSCPD